MKNNILLIRHQKKLSIYFALFVLFCLWTVQGIFVISSYVSNNIRLVDKLETRTAGVRNILENKEVYLDQFNGNDPTLKLVIEKTLENVTIYENGQKILGGIDQDIFPDQENILHSKDQILLRTREMIWQNDYAIIIETFNEYSYYRLFWEMILFALFSLPFLLLFYAIGFLFVGKNLLPIHEIISSLEDFTGNINHEIKTPLAEIVSTLGLAKRIGVNFAEAVDQSLKSAHKIDKILDSMNEIASLVDASYQREKLPLAENIKILVEEQKVSLKKKNVSISTVFSRELFIVRANRAHFEICVGNILKNAIKYSHEGGKIDISSQEGVLVIQDYGVGIAEESLGHIFDRYFRERYAREEGYGIGLSLVKKIADRNGWGISIESQKNSWTRVTLDFSASNVT